MNGIRRDLQFLVKPAGPDCNAACRYCFYLGKSSLFGGGVHRMSEEVLEVFVKKALRLRASTTLFSWQGGEPLLMGLDFYRRALEFMQRYGEGGQVVGNAFQTNGLLLDAEWAGFFSRYNFLVGISIDGPRRLHDFYRGEGTHARVMRSVSILRDHGVDVNVLSVLTDRTTPEVYDYLVEKGFTFLQFIPCVEVDRQGRLLPFSISAEAYGRFLVEVFDRWLKNGYPRINVRLFTDVALRLRGAERGGMCTFDASCDGYLVVEHDGSVFPCDFFVEKEWMLGNVLEHEMSELLGCGKRTTFARLKENRPPACNECRWYFLCRGGCLKDRLPLGGDVRSVPSALCKAYKMFFEQAVPRLLEIVQRPVGRNDPCPCGSGRKYKACCGRKKGSPSAC